MFWKVRATPAILGDTEWPSMLFQQELAPVSGWFRVSRPSVGL